MYFITELVMVLMMLLKNILVLEFGELKELKPNLMQI
jgi:hypothetical protein